jgi:hypothetical protein
MAMTLPEQDSTNRAGAGPWIGYDADHVRRIMGFVAKSTPTQARAVRTYESANMGRAEVIAAADRRLAKLHA